jgi:MoaA/NifB/PqqE/SkfB family radical SAM enzyme
MKSDVGYHNRTPRQFANDLLGVKSFERGEAWSHHHPVEVYVQVASACNLDCYMCYEHLRPKEFKRGRGLRVLGPELFAKIEREMLPYSTKITFGVGGEPMLCEHLLDYIERSYALNQHVHLMTNGTRIKTDKVAEVLARCLSSMEISLDASTKETYERIRIGSKWEHILANFERLNRYRMQYPKEERTHLALCFVMMRSNVHELPGFVELGRQLGADRVSAWHVIPVTPQGKEESLQYDKEKSDHYLRLAHLKARELGMEADFVKPFSPALEAELAPLIAASRQGAIARKEDRELELQPDSKARLDERPASEWMEDEQAWARPLTGKSGEGQNVQGTSPRLPKGALHAERKPIAEPEPHEHSAEEEPWKGTTIVEGLGQTAGEIDPASGVRMGAAWHAEPDPPPPEEARKAWDAFVARANGKRLHCHMPTLTAFIFYDGRVFPCCHPHAHTKLPMGDLRAQSFQEIWNGRAYRNLRGGLAQGDPPPLCQRCSIMQSPPPVFENEDELEGRAADLASYYGNLDLEPRAKHEHEGDLVAGLDRSGVGQDLRRPHHELADHEALQRELVAEIQGLKREVLALEAERDQLRPHAATLAAECGAQAGHIATIEAECGAQAGHIATIEAECGAQAGHIATLAAECDAQAGHIATLEAERDQLRPHAATLAAECGAQAGHIATLEAECDAQAGHIATIEAERDAQAGHIATIEAECGAQADHIATIEREVLALRSHRATIEAEREHLRGHVRNLERILDRIHGRGLYRLLCAVKDTLLFWRRERPDGRDELRR